MKRYEFKPNTDSEAILREIFEDGSAMDLYIEIRKCTVVVSTMHGSIFWSSPVIDFVNIDVYGGSVLFMMVLAGLGHFGIGFKPSIDGSIDQHILDWCRTNVERRTNIA